MYQLDSRKINKGDTFVCLPGGEAYINAAHDRGAVDVIKMTREQLAPWSAEHFGHPSRQLTVVGITGTNGKTTVANLVHNCLMEQGIPSFCLGTINSDLTTPESLDLQRIMAEHVDNGGTHFVMEVSSHGIHQGRIAEVEFDVKLLTNITQDHLGYHGTFENYKNTKLSFMNTGTARSIFPENYKSVTLDFDFPLLGAFNRENAQATVAVLRALNIADARISRSLENAKAPPGRFEAVDAGQAFIAIVDFAHTPDALENVLKTARPIAESRNGRLLLTFGCGGDRDRTKRPRMAQVAHRLADYVILTQDNPRSESEDQIMADILSGLPPQMERYRVINSRLEAIRALVQLAAPEDVLVVAGKGHETYQILNTGTIHFDDREALRTAIRERVVENSI